jgi:hypothetical protein
MALWGISTTTETAANNYNVPKFLKETDRVHSPHDAFADERGWIFRNYKSVERSGLSTSFYDEVLVPVAGLNTTGISSNSTGLGNATPVALFFEDPNQANPISIGAGGTTGIGTGQTGYVHLVFNENVYVSAGATILISQANTSGTTVATIVATATSITPNAPVYNYVNGTGFVTFQNYNGQITNRVAFAFTAPTALSGIGSVLRIDTSKAFTGIITDFYNGVGVTSTFTEGLIRNVGGAGTTAGVGLGTTTLTVVA